jgi:REP element-mobilizing transposase RayT
MASNDKQPARKSLRLAGYDYSQAGAYLVTICCKDRASLFGSMSKGSMDLSRLGRLVENHWIQIPSHYFNVQLDEFVVMPNHLHGIVIILDAQFLLRYESAHNVQSDEAARVSNSLGSLVGSFKSGVTREWHNIAGNKSMEIWQRNYHEWIARDEAALHRFREYVVNNPVSWELDSENPDRIGLQDQDPVMWR